MTQNLQPKLVEKKYLLTFILITSLFALWGFANDITNPMVAAFQTVMELTAAKASLVQFAFYGGYATMAIPAALFAKKYSYKKGILLGLILYAIGAFMFIPAANRQEFGFFCVSLYVLTFGLAFLETTANPYILSLGSKETSTRRLNLAQAFNPIGSLMGMFVASSFVLANLHSDTKEVREIGFSNLDEMTKLSIREHDLDIIRNPYVALGCVVLLVFIIIAIFVKNDDRKEESQTTSSSKGTLKRLFSNKVYRSGVLTQFFYVAAQIMVWTFIIQYADRLGIDKATAQMYNIIAMGMFLCGRFISTFLMKYVNSRKLLMFFAIGAMLASAGTILIDGVLGLYCLMGISIFMSLMFPTIYGIALENVSLEDSTLGAAFLVMAIVGGSLMPPIQGMIIDLGMVGSLPAVNFSFILPFICFLMIFIYGLRTSRMK
ncbi:MAG: L-fucose:H+ symporter permease [Bacteroidales bacterium]|nr:L-fucose:H+ symporter permease [Bacteroidales bacterium]